MFSLWIEIKMLLKQFSKQYLPVKDFYQSTFFFIHFIFIAKNKTKKITESKSSEDEKQRRKDEDKLVDLALEWNYFDGALLILQARQEEITKKKKTFIEVEDIYLWNIFSMIWIDFRMKLIDKKNYFENLWKKIVRHLLNIFSVLVLIH